MNNSDANKIYQFRIELKDIKVPVWRTVQVPGNYTFWDLHCAFQDAMGWKDKALHEFVLTDSSDTIYIIALPDDEMIYEALNERQEHISDHLTAEKQNFEYMYDFDNGWEHDVVLEKIIPADEKQTYPACIDGKMACPPEDTGGSWEYDHVIEVLSDKSHEEYEETVEWLDGRVIDPENFKLENVVFRNPEESWKNRFGEISDNIE